MKARKTKSERDQANEKTIKGLRCKGTEDLAVLQYLCPHESRKAGICTACGHKS